MAIYNLAEAQVVNANVTGISGKVLTLSSANETYQAFNIDEHLIIMQTQDDVSDISDNSCNDESFRSGMNVSTCIDDQSQIIFSEIISSNAKTLTNNETSGCNDNSDPDDATTPSLIYFIGFYNKDSDEVELKWVTTSEFNNDNFILERSSDGLTFNPIGNIQKNETSSIVNKYQYTDNDNEKGNSCYYRLSQIDLDGTTKNHEAIYVERELKPSKIWIYPTPVQQKKNIHIDFEGLHEGIYTVAILNTSGDKIIQDQVNINYNFQSMEIDTINIPNGLYMIHIFSAENTFIQRIIVQ